MVYFFTIMECTTGQSINRKATSISTSKYLKRTDHVRISRKNCHYIIVTTFKYDEEIFHQINSSCNKGGIVQPFNKGWHLNK